MNVSAVLVESGKFGTVFITNTSYIHVYDLLTVIVVISTILLRLHFPIIILQTFLSL